MDRTTVALGVEVCSFYLLDRDGTHLTLAATNGLDAERVARSASRSARGFLRDGLRGPAVRHLPRRDRRPAVQLGSRL
ncbi:MAG: hypothetical protein U0838_12110 [Chloroflexota bacterium]